MRDSLREGAPLASVLLSFERERAALIEEIKGIAESCADLVEREPSRFQRWEETIRRWFGLPQPRLVESVRVEMLARLRVVFARRVDREEELSISVHMLVPHVAWERIRVVSETVRSLQ